MGKENTYWKRISLAAKMRFEHAILHNLHVQNAFGYIKVILLYKGCFRKDCC